MLSFIFLADGPCADTSWRPNEDKAQWWSRRDALVRILSASTWLSNGLPNGEVGDACFLFENQTGAVLGSNQTDDQFCRPILMHNVEQLASTVPVPTEKNLIKLWKDVFSGVTKQRRGGPEHKVTSSVVSCSLYPWRDMLLQVVGSASGSPENGSALVSMDTGNMDKRELLKLLQTHCPVEFLRKHGLNGSESLILKKKNKDAMTIAFEDWRACGQSSAVSPTEAQKPITTRYLKLLDTCKVLLEGIVSRAEARFRGTSNCKEPLRGVQPFRATLLLLHEDYPHELPVFTDRVTDRCTKDKDKPIICAMGAVRDATDEEVAALIEAARSLNIRCVGANLGRTAEFTSKIVAALVAHSIAGQLHSAVGLLSTISEAGQSAAIGALVTGPSDSHAIVTGGVQKLAPQRHGAWSWDGQSNKRKRDTSVQLTPADAHPSKRGNISQSTQSAACASTTHPVKSVHHMHIVAWLPITVAEVTDALERRETMVGLVQLIVTSLWRSRLASEAAHDAAEADANNAAESAKVVPVLHLVFRDHQLATLTQSRLAIAMANQHMAAPSEYQVLQMLLFCLKDPDVLTTTHMDSHELEGSPSGSRSSASAEQELQAIMSRVLPAGLRKSERKALRVVELTDTSDVCGVTVVASAGSMFGKTQVIRSESVAAAEGHAPENSIAMHAYRGKCSCETTDLDNAVQGAHVVLLINRMLHSTGSFGDTVSGILPLHRCIYTHTYPDKELPEGSKLVKKMSNMVFVGRLFNGGQSAARRTAPSIAVTVLQHFAYHDRLVPAIELAIEASTCA